MSMTPCGAEGNIEGGSISQSTILDSAILNSTLSNSVFDKGEITNLSSIDDPSVKKIVDGIAKLPAAQLATLAQVLFAAYNSTPITPPKSSDSAVLPTTVIGGRSELLGSPTAWVTMGGYALPLYTK